MRYRYQAALLMLSVVVLSACATKPPHGPGGKHLVYRDSGGTPLRQFDYPSDEICKRVEAMAGRDARCESDSQGAQLQARSTLRYTPPGVMVEGHYRDLDRCRADTQTTAPGVEVIHPCTPKLAQ